MRSYEIMFIVRPNLEEANVRKVANDFIKILEDNSAKILDKKDFGQKELAYDIDGHKTGYYFLYQIETDNVKAIEEFDRLAKISENIVRHMILKNEK
jgi:small subunit ribosomal protein S6